MVLGGGLGWVVLVGLSGEVVGGVGTCSRALARHCSIRGLVVALSVGGGIFGMAKVVTLLDLGAVGASECCEYPSPWLLGSRLGFGVKASVSRSKANWMLISSNCLRRIHNF